MTVARQPEGWVLSVVVGLPGQALASRLAAGLAIPPPQRIRGLVDTGSDITGISATVLAALGSTRVRQHTTHMLTGPVPIDIFEVSLAVSPAGPTGPVLAVFDRLQVMGLAAPPDGLDAILGTDVLDHLLILLDGPRREATLAD